MADLNDTLRWLFEYSAEAAHQFVDNIETRCKSTLAVTPQAGRMFSNYNNETIYLLVIRGFSLSYQLHEADRKVYVLRVFREMKDAVPIL